MSVNVIRDNGYPAMLGLDIHVSVNVIRDSGYPALLGLDSVTCEC